MIQWKQCKIKTAINLSVQINTHICICCVLFQGMVKSIKGSYKFSFHPEGEDGEEWQVDFTPPWRRIDMIADLQKELGVTLPKPEELHTEEARKLLDRICEEKGVECSAPRTTARLLDKVC